MNAQMIMRLDKKSMIEAMTKVLHSMLPFDNRNIEVYEVQEVTPGVFEIDFHWRSAEEKEAVKEKTPSK